MIMNTQWQGVETIPMDKSAVNASINSSDSEMSCDTSSCAGEHSCLYHVYINV